MDKNRYPAYGIVIVAGAALAVWAGMPAVFLLVVLCPLMMFFMMMGMPGGRVRDADNDAHSLPTETHATAAARTDDRP